MQDPLVQQFVDKSVSGATAKNYKRSFHKWQVFAENKQWRILPADPKNFASFIAYEGQQGASAGQLTSLTAAVAHRHAVEGHPSPTAHHVVRKVLEGAKRAAARPSAQKEPLSFTILREVGILVRRDSTLPNWRTYWRMVIEFYALLRWEEAAGLRINDLVFHQDHLDLYIGKSKTDQKRKGSWVRVARHKDTPHDCPVNITLIYIRMLKYPSGFNGSLQPRIIQDEQGQRGSQQHEICYSRSLQDLKALIAKTGRSHGSFGEHSGRRGGATAAAKAGAKWTDLKRLGRWASDAAPQLYVENTERRKSQLPQMLAAAAQAEATVYTSLRQRTAGRRVTEQPDPAPTARAVPITLHPTLNVILPPAGREAPAGPHVIPPPL